MKSFILRKREFAMKKKLLLLFCLTSILIILPNIVMASIAADIFFLMDTTSSMGTPISNIKNSLNTVIIPGIVFGSGSTNLQYGAGSYKDVGESYVYKLDQNLTANGFDLQNAMNKWSASGGGDDPEANLYALKQMASAMSPIQQVSWRPDSTHIAIWIGDAPGHDPSNGVTESDAINALRSANVIVEAFSINGGLGDQASRIAIATGGHYHNCSSNDLGNLIVSSVKNDLNPVPIPAAVWLFTSGLAGLAAIRKKFMK